MSKDLSKPFFRKVHETDTTVTYESNLPNDSVGDLAFEWDLDGSKKKEWEAYIAELERKGTRGQLIYSRWEFLKNPDFDGNPLTPEINIPLTSYKFLLLDVN